MWAIPNSLYARGTLLVGLVAVIGCRGGEYAGDRPQVVSVSGVVTYQGDPMEGATVTFRPKDGDLPSAFGKTNARGQFRLQTFDPDDGAVPGEHVVTIVKYEIIAPDVDEDAPDYDPDTAPPTEQRRLIPERYGRPNTSDLSATVVAGETNDFTFALED